jgi:ribonuclease HI
MMSVWIAYADGGCVPNPGQAGIGVVIVSPEGDRYEGYEFLGQGTNNVAELTAVMRACSWLPPKCRPIVYTDSKYVIGLVHDGHNASRNVELVDCVRKLVAECGAKLVHVRAHTGVELNELADALAMRAIRSRTSKRIEVHT